MAMVLIVDDSSTMRSVVRRSVMMAGVEAAEIAEATDGLAALEVIEVSMPALILCDVNMPRLDGTGLLEELRRRYGPKMPPVVMITSVANARTLLNLVRLGAAKVIRKPFDPNTLANDLRAFLPQVPAAAAAPPAPPTADYASYAGAPARAVDYNGYAPRPQAPEPYAAAPPAPEAYKPPPYAAESYASQPYLPEPYKAELYKPEPYKPEPFRPEPHRAEPPRADAYKPETYAGESYAGESYAPQAYVQPTYAPEGYAPPSYAPSYAPPTYEAPALPQLQIDRERLAAVTGATVREVLETMAFAYVTATDEPIPPTRVMYHVAIPFIGVSEGRLSLAVTAEVATNLAISITGTDPGLDDSQRLDAVAELANVVIGELARKLPTSLDISEDALTFGLPSTDVWAPGRLHLPGAQAFEVDTRGHTLFVEVML